MLCKTMNTPTLDQIRWHRSIRQYTDDPVDKNLVETVVAAAQRSSTSSNLQMYSVVAVTDVALKERLAQLCGEQQHIVQAPVFLAWCADLSRLDRICQLRGYEHVSEYVENFLLSAVDTAILMQTAALAAESLGLGLCFIGAIRNSPQRVIELLKLPRLVFPISGMTLGWAAAEPALKPRLPLEAVLHWEGYDCSLEGEVLNAYDKTMAKTAVYKGRQVASTTPGAQQKEEGAYGWLEHTARRVSTPKRTGLRQTLVDQGFNLR